MTIGARVLKTGLAIAVALWVGTLLHLEAPIIAAIAAIFMIQPSIHRSWLQMLDQLQSNALGAAIALGSVWIVGSSQSSPILVGLVSVGVILLCIRFKMEETIGLTLVTVVIVMEAHGQGWNIALDRLAALLTGIVSAFVVNVAISPPRHRVRLEKFMQDAETMLSRLLRTVVSKELKENVAHEDYERLKTMLRKLDEFFELYSEERILSKKYRMHRDDLLAVYKGMLLTLEKGVTLFDAVAEHYGSINSKLEWSELIDRHIESLCGYHEQLVWKWQGMMKPGSSAAAPSIEATLGLSELIVDLVHTEKIMHAQLLVITSAVYVYHEKLIQLDKLMEIWLDNNKKELPIT